MIIKSLLWGLFTPHLSNCSVTTERPGGSVTDTSESSMPSRAGTQWASNKYCLNKRHFTVSRNSSHKLVVLQGRHVLRLCISSSDGWHNLKFFLGTNFLPPNFLPPATHTWTAAPATFCKVFHLESDSYLQNNLSSCCPGPGSPSPSRVRSVKSCACSLTH